MQKILIVGVNSFLSTQLVNLLRDKFEITGIYNKNTNNVPKDIELISIDQLNRLSDDFSFVYVISAFVPDKGNNESSGLYEVNVLLIEKLVELFKSARFIFASSVSIYGKSDKVVDENSGSFNANAYGLSKLWAEDLIKKHRSYAILRISSMYGEGMKTNTFLPLIIRQALNNKVIVVYGDGSRKQNYIHVNDVAEMLFKAAKLEHNFIGLAVSPDSVSNLEVAQLVKKNCADTSINHMNEDNEISYYYNADYTYKILKFIPAIKISSGILDLIKWLKK